MSDVVAEFLRSSNFIQLIAIGVMFWFFYTRLDVKITAVKTELRQEITASKTELRQEIASVKTELEDLGEKVEDVDRRLCRIEGSLATQGHCLFGQRETKQAG